ncbi:fibronectin type III domain-containing protein [bacterium]|nr:fibronectin type III domain-containing protein [bacterium]
MSKLKIAPIKIVFILIALTIAIFSVISFINNQDTSPVSAGPFNLTLDRGHNISGFAWSANIGWISFNSSDCDIDGNGRIDTNAMVLGCGGDNTNDIVNNYGVHIEESTGWFSGYAWSANAGWISFNRGDSSVCTNGFNLGRSCVNGGDCPGGPCGAAGAGATENPPSPPYNLGGGAIAKLNYSNGEVTGWAKIISQGDEGWIKLRDASWASGTEIISNTFNGWGWNPKIGWVSLNCENENNCAAQGGNDYETIGSLIPRAPTGVTVSNVPQPNACSFLNISWNDNSDNESGFLVQTSADGSSGWADICDVSANTISCIAVVPHSSTLYFRVRSYNLVGGDSAWAPVPGTGTGGTNGISGKSADYCAAALSIISYSCDCINLLWTVAGDETLVHHYRIERNVASGGWTTLEANHPQGNLSYDDCNIDSGVIKYEYRVTAYNDAGETKAAVSNIAEIDDPCSDLPSWWEDK